MARTASIPGHDFIWKTAADAGFAPMWWRRPLMCRFCSPWFPAVLESLPSAMIWPVSARARWLYPPAGGSLCQRPPDVERGQPESRPAPPAGRIPVHLLNTAQATAPPIRWDRRRCYSGPIFCGVLPGRFLLQDILHQNRNTPVGVPLQTDADLLGIPLRAASSMPSKSSAWLPRSVRQSA